MNTLAQQARPFTRSRFLEFPLDNIPSMERLLQVCRESIAHRQVCRIMGISGPSVAQASNWPELVAELDCFTVIVPDGKGIELFAPWLGVPCGPTLALPNVSAALLELAFREHLHVFILGATAAVNAQARANLAARYPGIRLSGRDGYFSSEDDKVVAEEIKAAGPDILLLAMPTPKKEFFVNRWHEFMQVPVAVGCGGYIDTVAGVTRLAPPWASKLALSWLVRVIQEPRKLWRRILIGEFKFLWLVLRGVRSRWARSLRPVS